MQHEPVSLNFRRLRDFSIRHLRMAREQLGSSLVEFAMSFSLLLAIMFGIVDFARALYAYDAISDAARIGTRYAIVNGSSSASPATATTVASYVSSNCCTSLNHTNMTVVTTWNPNNNPGSTVKVQVQYTFSFILPYLPTSSLSLSASSQMVIAQ